MGNLEVAKSRSATRRAILREIANAYKSKGCQICSEKRIPTLSFHHVNPKTKVRDISHMVQKSFSTDALQREMAKCVVLCHNCHALVECGELEVPEEIVRRMAV